MREKGFYWVMLNGKWTVGEFNGVDWDLVGDEDMFTDAELERIGNRIPDPPFSYVDQV